MRRVRIGRTAWSTAIPLHSATAAYYRSHLLNILLPGGVLGDVDRAVRHGSAVGAPLLVATWLRRRRSAADPFRRETPIVGPGLVPAIVRVEDGGRG